MSHQTDREIKKYYLFQIVFNSIALTLPIVVLFMLANNLSFTQTMIVYSFSSLVLVVLEIPTGYFADVFGRRTSLISGAFFLLFGALFYALGHTFVHFLIAGTVHAIGRSLYSGANSAFIFDHLKQAGRSREFKKIWGRIVFGGLLAAGFYGLFGGLLGAVSFRLAFWARIPFSLVLIIIAFTLREPERGRPIYRRGYLLEIFAIIKKYIVRHSRIRWIIFYSALLFAVNLLALWLFQPYFEIVGIDVAYFGFIFGAFQAVAAFGSRWTQAIEEKLGIKKSLLGLVILTGGSFLFMGHFIFLWSFSLAFVSRFVRGFREVFISDCLNHLIPSSVRATVLSVESMFGRLCYALIIPLIGLVADAYSPVQALTVLGLTTLVGGGMILAVIFKNNLIEPKLSIRNSHQD